MRGVKIVSRTETTKIIVDDETRPIPIILFLLFTVATTAVSIKCAIVFRPSCLFAYPPAIDNA